MVQERETSRREFLQGRAAARAIADLVPEDPPDDGARVEGPPAAGYLLELSRNAMACEFQVSLNAGQHRGAEEAALQALDLVDRLESQLTVYRPESEVSRLNRAACAGPVQVEPRLFGLLVAAAELHAETGGAFDITSGPLSQAWGFFRRQGRVPPDAEIQAALARIGSPNLVLDPAASSVRFTKPGLEINLNSIGKGYALDRCAELLLAAGVRDFAVHGGHSSILARGSRTGPDAAAAGWVVALRNPLRLEQRLGEIRLRDRALGTSGTAAQFFYSGGRRFGHLLDPRTGWPVEHTLSTTVLAPTAAQADALATALFVMGPDAAAAYLQAKPDLAAIFVLPGSRAGDTNVVALGMKDDEWRRSDAE